MDIIDVRYVQYCSIGGNHHVFLNNATVDDHVLLDALRNFSSGSKKILEGKWPQNGDGACTTIWT